MSHLVIGYLYWVNIFYFNSFLLVFIHLETLITLPTQITTQYIYCLPDKQQVLQDLTRLNKQRDNLNIMICSLFCYMSLQRSKV